MFPRRLITEFERKVDVQNHQFGWVRFENRFSKNSTTTTIKFVVKILQ